MTPPTTGDSRCSVFLSLRAQRSNLIGLLRGLTGMRCAHDRRPESLRYDRKRPKLKLVPRETRSFPTRQGAGTSWLIHQPADPRMVAPRSPSPSRPRRGILTVLPTLVDGYWRALLSLREQRSNLAVRFQSSINLQKNIID